MSTVITDNKHYTDIATKIRSVSGTTTKYKPSEMPQAITNIQNVVDDYSTIESGAVFYNSNNSARIIGSMHSAIFAGSTIDTFEIPENITSVSDYAFYRSNISKIIFHDNVISIGDNCFYFCTNLTSVELPNNLQSLGGWAFAGCKNISEIIIPESVTSIDSGVFQGTKIVKADIHANISGFNGYTFFGDSYLEILILRNDSSVIKLYNDNEFGIYCPIADGTGYIYVPASLVDAYKSDSTWATFTNQIRAIEDYPEICG